MLATARDIPATPREIGQRLGAGSSAHALDRATLLDLYKRHSGHAAVLMKRRLWARLLTTALGTQFEDSDEDGLSDTFEEAIGTDPNDWDSDNDGLSDSEEVGYDGDATDYNPYHPIDNPAGTDLNANSNDTDADGVNDLSEVSLANADPLDPSDGVNLSGPRGRIIAFLTFIFAWISRFFMRFAF